MCSKNAEDNKFKKDQQLFLLVHYFNLLLKCIKLRNNKNKFLLGELR